MRVNHHISVGLTDAERDLNRAGVQVEKYRVEHSSFLTFDIFEDDDRWSAVKSIISSKEALDIVTPVFTSSEVLSAPYLTIETTWESGYPKPEGSYLERTYDLSDYCRQCGVGKRQIAPFRIGGEPKWGRKSLFRLFWVPDEYFTTPEVWARLLKSLGVECREVLNRNGTQVLDNVVQISALEETDLAIPESLPFMKCEECERVRYSIFQLPQEYPGPISDPVGPVFRSRQWFGDGHMAFQHILCRQEVATAVTANKLASWRLLPCAP